MSKIPLKGEKFSIVDSDIFQKYGHLKWHQISGGYVARNGKWINKKDGKREPSILLHRLIMGAKKGEEVDHIDKNVLNNTRSNLRLVSRSKNNQNRNIFKNNKSGYQGVVEKNGRWYAKINVNKKRIHLGGFNSPTLAHKAYLSAREKYFT